ncbi:MAG: SUF system NifU family Fe-S cluster assembly protein [Candidatus Aenigmarchaeota archaeon]|nr:SUF system NifU family Fe-S cluster assembly protein [Candidatus Aenigmarchaeota archaeon]
MLDMYAEEILERYKDPVNRGEIKNATAEVHETNPLCGDSVDIYLKIENGKISEAKFNGFGCAISQASADLLLDEIRGKSSKDAKSLAKEQFLKTLGISLSPARLKCALLSWYALMIALQDR